MNDRKTGKTEDLPEAILEDAAVWYARLRDNGAEDAQPAEFEIWLRADPRHLHAFRETERLWQKLEAPVAQVLAEEPGKAPVPGPTTRPARAVPVFARMTALAASLLILIASGLVWHDDVVMRLRSDHATAVGEQAVLTLEDASRVTLNSDSAIAVEFGPSERQVRLLRGEAWFMVSPEDARPFVVGTAQGAVRVTGTHFDVRLEEEETVVSLMEGQVELTARAAPDDTPIVLAPGLQATLTTDGVSGTTPFDRTAVSAWLRGQMVFYDTPLSEVVAALNRHRAGHIHVVGADLDALRISGVFRTDDPDRALAVIADTLPLRVTRLTDYLVLLH